MDKIEELIWLIFGLNIADVIVTGINVSLYGFLIEQNPLIRFLFYNVGLIATAAIKVMAGGIGTLIFLRLWPTLKDSDRNKYTMFLLYPILTFYLVLVSIGILVVFGL